ncbi:MAG: nucleotidyltransferase [Oscillatoriales cyanobacterium RM2_1_1]|nr:nucleotidyltransferase [Oscillatoriales cyanobacterium SM2_3_0]NJO45165.1 nucleotidyltransferase [Oscillatoriales cyanobacterium RM2_1_1]
MTDLLSVQSKLLQVIYQQPYPLLFSTVSGAHLYGFPSPDSDYDLRGIHLLPLAELLGLDTGPETVEVSELQSGLQIDLVTHETKKFFGLLLRRNGAVLEQLYSPLIIHTTPEHQILKEIAQGCITRYHSHHYLGFAKTQWRLFEKDSPQQVKPLLYVYRVLLTGVYLMQTGTVEANLVTLNQTFRLSYLSDLIQAKLSGSEKTTLKIDELDFHRQEYIRWCSTLEAASQVSELPEESSAKPALHDLLLHLRLRDYSWR